MPRVLFSLNTTGLRGRSFNSMRHNTREERTKALSSLNGVFQDIRLRGENRRKLSASDQEDPPSTHSAGKGRTDIQASSNLKSAERTLIEYPVPMDYKHEPQNLFVCF